MNLSPSVSRIALFSAFVLLTAGCQAAPEHATPTQSVEEATEAIKVQALKFSAAYVSGEVDELVSIYTEDGMAAPSGRDFIVGREALRPFWVIPGNTRILRHKTTPTSFVVDGNHAYDWGIYEGQSERDGVVLPPFAGKYVIVWERGDDGVWRMAADMWNDLPAPATD
ncbi:MAG: ketosteroid isomerase-like protein [Rhodothermales bacterium]|jgi:ketosteroid isomerase-like protein